MKKSFLKVIDIVVQAIKFQSHRNTLRIDNIRSASKMLYILYSHAVEKDCGITSVYACVHISAYIYLCYVYVYVCVSVTTCASTVWNYATATGSELSRVD